VAQPLELVEHDNQVVGDRAQRHELRVQRLSVLLGLDCGATDRALDHPDVEPDLLLQDTDLALTAEDLEFRYHQLHETLGGRGFLYERFYLTSAARNKQMLHTRFFDRTRSRALLDDMLSRAGRG